MKGAVAPEVDFVEVPTSPSLGIELDMAAVEQFRVG
jgi:L-alanine-DL-glutamate epimerase-like enolase superfamily enzyme